MFRTMIFSGRVYAMTLAICLLGLGCNDDDAEPHARGQRVVGGGDAGDDASAPDCVLASDGICPEGCGPVHGQPWDEGRECWLQEVIMGCTPNGDDDRPAEGCYVDIEGSVIYRTRNLYWLSSSFRECTEEEPLILQESATKECK